MKKTADEKLKLELRLTTRRMTRIATALAFGGMTGAETFPAGTQGNG